MNDNPYQPPKANLQHTPLGESPATAPQRLGGWLILIGLGLVISPFRLGYALISMYWPLFQNGTWGLLTTPGTDSYHALWGPLLVFEIIGNSGYLVLGLVALVLFFKRSRRAPKVITAWLIWGLVFVTADFFLSDLIPAVAASADNDSLRELVRTTISAAVWVPYFLVSKRVQATFTRD